MTVAATADKRQFLKPGEGRTVRREDVKSLWPAEGDWAENTLFTRRRVRDGDLVQADAPKPVKALADGDKK